MDVWSQGTQLVHSGQVPGSVVEALAWHSFKASTLDSFLKSQSLSSLLRYVLCFIMLLLPGRLSAPHLSNHPRLQSSVHDQPPL